MKSLKFWRSNVGNPAGKITSKIAHLDDYNDDDDDDYDDYDENHIAPK